ncbi:hypothetical protein ACF3M1_09350 [Luteimonas sp. WGS1318]|uniref:hypothetical protein n=1 Tax=Luteimonas sp. WGS1318 TaxID=3366815 RepID=UPI00372D0F54
MSRLPLALSVSALLLAACGESTHSGDAAPIDEDAAGAPVDQADTRPALDEDIVVSTNEPFWQARLEGDTIVLTGVETAERRLADARSSMTSDGQRISARDAQGEVVLIVRRMRCEDDMSGARFPMTGLLTIDGRGPFRGCARPASMAPPAEAGDTPRGLPDAFLGRWDVVQAACTASDRGDLGLTVTPEQLVFHESVAVAGDVEVLDGDTVRASFEYEGEGERWQATQTLRLIDGGNTLVLDGPDGPGAARVRCVD